MEYTQEHLARRERVMKWYAPARLGLFYHWGLYTGGGCTHANPGYSAPLTYANPAALEAAAPDPELVARNADDLVSRPARSVEFRLGPGTVRGRDGAVLLPTGS